MIDTTVKLNDQDNNYKSHLFECYNLLCSHRVQSVVIKLLKEIIPTFSHSALLGLIQDTQYIFGNIIQRNVHFDRLIQREHLTKHIEALLTPKLVSDMFGNSSTKEPGPAEYDVVAKIERLIIDLDKEIEKSTANDNEISEVRTLPSISFSTDPSLLLLDITEDE
jgi:hypothetical protein